MEQARAASAVNAIVGRESQENVIDSTLDELAVGRSCVLLLSGEAGIGKSRMADEVVRRARSRGLRTAWAGAWQGDGVPPLWPWAQLLRQIVGSAEVLDRASVNAAAPSGSDVDPGRATTARFEQFEMVAAALRDGIGDRPLVAVLDDAHWADAATVHFAAFAAASLRDHPFLLVVTYRPDELAPDALATLLHIRHFGSTQSASSCAPWSGRRSALPSCRRSRRTATATRCSSRSTHRCSP